ncbi:hypothetical protein ASE12_01845 [Aeromicrobium sp. Root236]|nr:hypothetical protein ASE12_01845 [Aeromicrobium sp. Root236]
MAVVCDPASNSIVPTAPNEHGIAASLDIVAVRISHQVDGEATAEVWTAPHPGDLECIFDSTFQSASGAVILGDAAFERHAPAEVGEGLRRLRVLVGGTGRDLVVFEFTPADTTLGVERPHLAEWRERGW